MKKILVIDDDREILNVLKERLEANDYEVIVASDGVEGYAWVKDQRPDLIILDIMMPVLDGYGLLRELKGNFETKDIPVIILTARDDLENHMDSEKAECYMTKTCDAQELLSNIKKILSHV